MIQESPKNSFLIGLYCTLAGTSAVLLLMN